MLHDVLIVTKRDVSGSYRDISLNELDVEHLRSEAYEAAMDAWLVIFVEDSVYLVLKDRGYSIERQFGFTSDLGRFLVSKNDITPLRSYMGE